MNLFEYIKSQLPQMPNVQIMKDLGASDELVEYIKETPWNTNLGVLGSIGGSGEEDIGEVWFTGTLGECDEVGMASAILSETSEAQTADFIANYNDYSISMNGTPLVFVADGGAALMFADSTDESLMAVGLQITKPNPPQELAAAIVDVKCPTDITTVEVTVTKK